MAKALSGFGGLAIHQSDFVAAGLFYEQSLALFEESLTMRRDLGDKDGVAYCLESLANASLVRSDLGVAIVPCAAAETLREQLGAPLAVIAREKIDSQSAAARQAVGEAEFAAQRATGRGFNWEQAVDFALRARGSGEP